MKTLLKAKSGHLKQLRAVDIYRRQIAAQSFPAVKNDVHFEDKSEYTEKPEYPDILEINHKARKFRKEISWAKEIENLKTVEEKLIKINMPRYWGYKTISLNDNSIPYNCLPAVQHYTHTLFEEEKKLETSPDKRSNEKKDSKLDSLIALVRTEIKDSIEFSYDFFRHKYEDKKLETREREKLLGQIIVEQVNRVLINSLSADYPHLNEIEVDLNPRHEAFWSVGGIDPPKNTIKSKKGRSWSKDEANETVNRLFQYTGQPYLTLRHSKPLKPIITKDKDKLQNLQNLSLPTFKFDPRTLGFAPKYCHGTNIPGFWPGSSKGFGLISYQPRDYMIVRNPSFGAEDFQEALHAHAIMSSFAWLIALANYNGFSTLSDLTYPMYTQTIITNGREWSFYQYQLNTILIQSKQEQDNPKLNFCHGTKELKLFENFDANGKCIGFNDDIVRQLVQYYKNAPVDQQLSAFELQPYLGKDIKKVADYADAEKRIFLEKTFKHLCANRPRHLESPEIYLWEKIYKIDNKTRPLEARRRFFELNINPWRRTLDDRASEYIPRCLRPEEERRKKFKKTYYP